MELNKTPIQGLLIIKPDVFRDQRGYFFETYNRETFVKHGLDVTFVQDNESRSKKGVLRGMHFQRPPFAQGKLVRVVHGAIMDVALDLRQGSPTCGKWHAVELSDENKLMFWIPEGFAHGFISLADDTVVHYKCTNVYHRESEGSIRWNDPDIRIDWRISDPLVSDKDNQAPSFEEVKRSFLF